MSLDQLTQYYREFDEHRRLSNAIGQLEFTRTLDLLARYLPPAPAIILDIGGATGPYSEALAAKGYQTHLLDAMENHIEQARLRTGIASATLGDARQLPWPDAYADAALLFGPLYHLTTAADRAAALRETHRVLKPNAVLAAAAISRFASLLDGLGRNLVGDPAFETILLDDLQSGHHRNPTDNIEYFTTTHFHLPQELADEIENAGFRQACVFPVEGLASIAPELEQLWSQPAKRELLLEILRRTEEEPSTLGASPHLLAFAYKGPM